MATYAEMFDTINTNKLLDRLSVAIADQANIIITEAAGVTNHANRLLWAKAAISDPRGIGG